MSDPSAPHPATLISQTRLDAARPYIAMAMKGGGSVDDCTRAAIAAADQAGWSTDMEAAKKHRVRLMLIAQYPTWTDWTDIYECWWDHDRWARWPHPFPPTHWRVLPLPPAPGDATL